MKYKHLKKVLSIILTIILCLYISISMTLFTLLNISKNYVTTEKLENIVNNIDIASIIKNSIEIENIKNELIDAGLSTETVETFLNSKEVKDFENEVIISIFYDILNKGNIEYKLDTDKLNQLIYNNIDELKTSDKYNNIVANVESKLPILEDNVNDIIDKISNKLENSNTFVKYKNYINKLFKVVNIIHSDCINIIFIFVIVSFMLMLIFIRNNITRSLNWLGISFGITAFSLLLFNNILEKIFKNTKINVIFNIVSNDFNNCLFAYIITSIILISVSITIYFIKRKKYSVKKD